MKYSAAGLIAIFAAVALSALFFVRFDVEAWQAAQASPGAGDWLGTVLSIGEASQIVGLIIGALLALVVLAFVSPAPRPHGSERSSPLVDQFPLVGRGLAIGAIVMFSLPYLGLVLIAFTGLLGSLLFFPLLFGVWPYALFLSIAHCVMAAGHAARRGRWAWLAALVVLALAGIVLALYISDLTGSDVARLIGTTFTITGDSWALPLAPLPLPLATLIYEALNERVDQRSGAPAIPPPPPTPAVVS